jgi:hypothetical protein
MKTKMKNAILKLTATVLVWAVVLTAILLPINRAKAAGAQTPSGNLTNLYARPAKNFDLNSASSIANLRTATSEQLAALNNLKTAVNAPNMTVRWNDFSGSPDVVYDFASQPFSGTPEEAGRAFLAQNASVFGLSDLNGIQLFSAREALGGHLLRFQQTFNGVPVKDGGIGLVLNGNKRKPLLLLI